MQKAWRTIFDEEIMYLTREYHQVYRDTHEECGLAPVLVEDIQEMIGEGANDFLTDYTDFNIVINKLKKVLK